MSKDNLFIAENLRLLRKQAKLSQKEVADLMKVDRTTYTYYETGRSVPNYKNLAKLCHIFAVEPRVFFNPASNPTGPLIFRDPTEDNDYIYTEFKRKEEQMLLMNYRLLTEEQKRLVSKYIKSLGDGEK